MKSTVVFAALIVASGATFSAGLSRDEAAARKAVLAVLNDPDSAKFGKFTAVKDDRGDRACLTVNAKNAYGGYIGNRQAQLIREPGGVFGVGAISAMTHDECIH